MLCSKCNRSKGNKDNTDFRETIDNDVDPNCPLCFNKIKSIIIENNNTVVAIRDKYPATKQHTLLIPIRHTPDYFSMTSQEKNDAEELMRLLRNNISNQDSSITGFNIGMNCGSSAGQTIMHAHIHLIPRRNGDTSNPRGGIRGAIPEKMVY